MSAATSFRKTAPLLILLLSIAPATPPWNACSAAGPRPVIDGLEPYQGNLHSHTSYSDGEGTPTDAFDYARFTAGLDFLAVTDHSEQIQPWFPIPPLFRWSRLQNEADAANEDGAFVALAGYEYSHVMAGHLNVFGTRELFWYPEVFYLWSFYKGLVKESGAVGQFNHPYDEEYFHNWYDFYYGGLAVDQRISLIEADGFHEEYEDGYIRALEKGWHVAPVGNQDNHGWDWGTKDARRAGVWVESLTRDNVLDAMRNRRCFSATDVDASIMIKGNGALMGWATFTAPVDLEISVFDTHDDGWSKIELIGPGGEVLAVDYPDTSSYTWEITEYPSDNTFWYAKAYQDDGGILFSAPVWYKK